MLRWLLQRLSRPTAPKRPAPGADSHTKRASSLTPLAQVQHELRLNADITCQDIQVGPSVTCTLVYFESIIDTNSLLENLTRPLQQHPGFANGEELLNALLSGTVSALNVESTSDIDAAVSAILEGSCALITDNEPLICLFPLATYSQRAVTESQNELVIVGPQEAFVENVHTNLSLIRHKLKHSDFKTVKYTIGRYTKTSLFLFYIEGLCDEEMLASVKDKVSSINIDSVLGASYVAEFIDTSPYSPFPTVQFTERPDSLVASLLEGRIGIMVDGTPQTIIVPVTFFAMMQSPEDYYQGFLSATWIRWIRLFFASASFLVPSIYVAISTFHPEMIPSNLLVTISAARENIPIPALTEVVIMELTFEGLREAGIRIPRPLGQTVSIIGAIVIGQAAVQAGIVSAPTVIVVSITGIASFIIPHFEMGLAFRLLRFPLLILGGTLGIFGVIVGLFLMFFHLVTIRSFGVPYMHPLAPLVLKDWKDVFIRARWPKMNNRPDAFGNQREQRQGEPND